MCGDVSTVCDRAAVRCGLGDGRPTGLLQPVAARSRQLRRFRAEFAYSDAGAGRGRLHDQERESNVEL